MKIKNAVLKSLKKRPEFWGGVAAVLVCTLIAFTIWLINGAQPLPEETSKEEIETDSSVEILE